MDSSVEVIKETGETVKDKVFILSQTEWRKYRPQIYNSNSRYMVANPQYISTSCEWLRQDLASIYGVYLSSVKTVVEKWVMDGSRISITSYSGVRPVIWVNVK